MFRWGYVHGLNELLYSSSHYYTSPQMFTFFFPTITKKSQEISIKVKIEEKCYSNGTVDGASIGKLKYKERIL